MTPEPPRPPVVVDTSVVVAGVITREESSPVARMVDGMLASTLRHVVSEALLAEYRTVLLRPRTRKLHKLSTAEIERLLTDIAQRAIVLMPCPAPPAPDPKDQHLYGLLAAHDALVLVTGDKALLRDPAMAPRVVTARTYLDGD